MSDWDHSSTKKFDPAYPIGKYTGLTKREYAAIAILQGIWANDETQGTHTEFTAMAVRQADALFAELNKSK